MCLFGPIEIAELLASVQRWTSSARISHESSRPCGHPKRRGRTTLVVINRHGGRGVVRSSPLVPLPRDAVSTASSLRWSARSCNHARLGPPSRKLLLLLTPIVNLLHHALWAPGDRQPLSAVRRHTASCLCWLRKYVNVVATT